MPAWLGRKIGPDFGVCGRKGDAAPGGAFNKSLHDEERLVDLFESRGVFANRDRQRRKPHGASGELVNHGL